MYHKICLMNHIMHIGDKWNILTLCLVCHSGFKALEGANHVSIKMHQPWNNVLLFQISLCHQKVHYQQHQAINPRSKEHLLHIQQQWCSTLIMYNVIMHTCPTYIIHCYDLITSKKNKVGILKTSLITCKTSFCTCSVIF